MTTARTGAWIAAAFLAAAPLAADPAPAPLPRRSADFPIELKAAFLELGRTAGDAPESEIAFDPPVWTSTLDGRVRARVWGLSTWVSFHRTAPSGSVSEVHIEGADENGNPEFWNVWRHRHGYLYSPEDGYHWNSLEDVKPPMEEARGRFYDRVLRETWGYWVARRLPAALDAPNPTPPPPDPDEAFLRGHLRLTFDANGVAEPEDFTFDFHLWDMPVKVALTLAPPAPGQAEHLAVKDFRFTYDRAIWRSLHGYRRDLFNNLEWEEGFPDAAPLSDEEATWLDDLMQRCVAYWADALVAQLTEELETQLSEAAAVAFEGDGSAAR